MASTQRSREYRYRWIWDLPASPEALWPLVSDTDSFNRDTGLPEVADARAEGEELTEARRRLRLSIGPVTIEWEEMPFEWVRPHRFGVARRYRRGPLAEMRVLAELAPLEDARTRLVYTVVARPSGWLGALTIPLQIGVLSRRAFGRVFREYARRAGDGAANTVPRPRSGAAGTAAARRLAAMEKGLSEAGVDPEVRGRLSTHLATADEGSLARVRPYVLANLWKVPPRSVLEACLHATRSGHLDLRWDVLCPLCRGSRESAPSLAELRHRGVHCDTCLVDFDGDFTTSVELTFRPTPAVREVRPMAFCVAGPQVTPHIVAQQLLAPGEQRRLRPRLTPGSNRIRRHGSTDGIRITVRADAPEEAGEAEELGFGLTEKGWTGAARAVGPTPVLCLENRTEAPALVLVERTAWGDDAVTAAEVTRLGVFRDLFSDEVLRTGEFAGVGTLSVLFTDLRGSTAMYRRVGDAPAFSRVMRHFEILREAVRGEDGAVVKTIGDAVMAVFPTPDRAVAAALAAHGGLAAEEGPDGTHERLVLKAGVHVGPCMAVTLDGRLDYFGSTVNFAARLEALSRGGDVVVSESVIRDPAVEALLADGRIGATSLVERIRGLDEEVTLWRLVAEDPAR